MFIFLIVSIAIIYIALKLDFPINFPYDLLLGLLCVYAIMGVFKLQEIIISWLCKKSVFFDRIYSSYNENKQGIRTLISLVCLFILVVGLLIANLFE